MKIIHLDKTLIYIHKIGNTHKTIYAFLKKVTIYGYQNHDNMGHIG